MSYELGGGEPGAPLPLQTPIELELLGFGEATTDDVVLGGEERVVLWPTVGSHRAAVVSAPAAFEGETLSLVATYRIERAIAREGGDVAVRAEVPILSGPPVLTDLGGAAFEARLLVPEAWALSEGFPSALRRREDGSYGVSLPVVPAVVSFHARTDGSWRPGFPLLIDLMTVLILVTFSAFGWRHLRSVAR